MYKGIFNKNNKGFTLVELLVVISILAILSVIGITVFGNTQRNARDTRRQGDVTAMSNVMETQKVMTATTYPAAILRGTSFASGAVPADSQNANATYCILSRTDGAAITKPIVWLNTAACPTAVAQIPATTVETITTTGTTPIAAPNMWYICTLLETGANPNNIYCVGNRQ